MGAHQPIGLGGEAAHGVLIPLETEYFALRGVALLVETIDKVRDRLNPAIKLDGILATMYDSRTLHSREVLERVVEAFGHQVLETVINRTVKFPDASVAAAPIKPTDSTRPMISTVGCSLAAPATASTLSRDIETSAMTICTISGVTDCARATPNAATLPSTSTPAIAHRRALLTRIPMRRLGMGHIATDA